MTYMPRFRVPHWVQWATGATVAAGAIAWGVAAGRMIWYAGDYMIGFHLLLLLPAAVVLLTGGAFALAFSRRFATGVLVGGVCIIPAAFSMHVLYGSGPEYAIATYARENVAAIAAADLPDLPEQSRLTPSEETQLAPLPGFRWYCENHIAAPDGIYLAWKSRGVVHVRVQKQRGGWCGVAYSRDANAIEKLRHSSAFNYRPSKAAGWWHWDTLER